MTQAVAVIDQDLTWNNPGLTYKAIRIRVRNTGSASGSKLIDLEVDGVSVFSVGKDGALASAVGLAGTTVSASTSYSLTGANGQVFAIKQLTELLTIAASATSTTTIQLPAKAIILAVSTRVTVALPVTTNFTVGDAGSAARYSTAAVAKAAGSTDPGTKAGAYYNATATGVVITPDTTPSDATGRVRVTINYIEVTPPTS